MTDREQLLRERLISEVKKDQLAFRMFVRGYELGGHDEQVDKSFDSKDDFRTHLRQNFEEVMSDE